MTFIRTKRLRVSTFCFSLVIKRKTFSPAAAVWSDCCLKLDDTSDRFLTSRTINKLEAPPERCRGVDHEAPKRF